MSYVNLIVRSTEQLLARSAAGDLVLVPERTHWVVTGRDSKPGTYVLATGRDRGVVADTIEPIQFFPVGPVSSQLNLEGEGPEGEVTDYPAGTVFEILERTAGLPWDGTFTLAAPDGGIIHVVGDMELQPVPDDTLTALATSRPKVTPYKRGSR